MSNYFRMRPKLVNGRPIGGGAVCIPIRFILPPVDPESPQTTPASAEATALALRIVDARRLAAKFRERLGKEAEDLESDEASVVSVDARSLVASALKEAAVRHEEDARTAMASVFVRTFTVGELRDLAAFADSVGSKVLPDDAAVAELTARLSVRIQRIVALEMHAAICGQRACKPTDDEVRLIASPGADGAQDVSAWLVQPTRARLLSAVPTLARIQGVDGLARLTCATRPDGYLDGCVVAAEAPAGWGFGSAALRLSKVYRLDPAKALTDQPGAKVSVRVDFPVPEMQHPEPLPSRSERATELATKLVAAAGLFPQYNAQLAAAPNVRASKELDAGVSEATTKAIQAAMRNLVDLVPAEVARLLAVDYSEEELASALAFYSSPTGRALQAKNATLAQEADRAMRRISAAVAAEGRVEFCKTNDCILDTPSPTASLTNNTATPD